MLAMLHNLPSVLLLIPEDDIFTTIIQKRKQWFGELRRKVTQLVSGKIGVQTSLAGLQHMLPQIYLRGPSSLG